MLSESATAEEVLDVSRHPGIPAFFIPHHGTSRLTERDATRDGDRLSEAATADRKREGYL